VRFWASGRRRARATGTLRASLEACTAEGLAAEIVGACFGNAVLTAWAVELGASPLLLGVLWGLPYFGQVFQLPALWLTSHLGRKRTSVLTHALGRQVTLPIAVLPFVDVSVDVKRAVVVGLFALSSLLAVLGHNAWLAWMGELVPARMRGAYFGRRTALCTIVATLASLLIASALDAGRMHGILGVALAAILVVRSLAGAMTTFLMLRQHDPEAPTHIPRMRDFARPIADRAFRTLLGYRAAWGIATGIAASLSAIYMLRALGLGFMGVALYSAGIAVLRVVTTPLWGRALDRAGGRRVLIACSLGAALSSLAWVFATQGSAWLIALDALVSGLLLGGQELAVFTLPLSAAPSARRPLYAAASVMVGGVAYGGASVVAGALAECVPLRATLAAAVLWRVVATLVATGVETRDFRRSVR
jgi:MFS family permease